MHDIDKAAIAAEVRRFQYEIWQRAGTSHNTIPHLLQLFRPDHAATVHSIEYDVAQGSLGVHGIGKAQYQVAGLVDVQRSTIRIAGNFPYEVQRFTGAHELGHIVLHPGLPLHRDRPLLGDGPVPDRREREANYFAACFLAPEKLVRRAFREKFGSEILHLDDRVAFAIASNSVQDLLRSKTGSLEFPRAVATAEKFGFGNHFKSLAQEFGMSPTAMAIRIKELELVSY
ncbi:ImmA/IrrE family metallo-endopeptidase [Paraburkholderia tropica]|uniref:ImmA/IrrE family metallo-endopeptidase n=1 Tax=Paraburkholderia tropica TaxID=92647 RepID=UPI001F38781A|nr:ImmA/IrrE family metallo-endopeptidase [Paraburkholderia tropica]